MSMRAARDRQYRRILAGGLGVSIAIHGAVLGLSNFHLETSASPGETPAERASDAEFSETPLELVQLELEPVVAIEASSPAPAAAAERPVDTPEPSAASPLDRLEMQVAMSMRPNYATTQNVSDWALRPVDMPEELIAGLAGDDDDDGHDHHSGGRSWWEGLGIALGIGGGGHCPVPERRPVPAVISGNPGAGISR